MGFLRVYLAISVVLSHMGYNLLLPADQAVELFFVISGFYMSFVLNERYNCTSQNVLFYKKRFLRLLPIYWICSLLGLLVAYKISLEGLSSELLFDFNLFKESNFSSYPYLIFSNLFALGEDLALFLHWNIEESQLEFTASTYSENYPMIRFFASPVAWSLGLEFLFYLIAPFFLRRNVKTVGLICIVSLIIKLTIRYYFGLNDGNWTYRFFPSELCCFCLGYFCYRLYTIIEIRRYVIPEKVKYAILTVFVLLSLYHGSYIYMFLTFMLFFMLAVPVLFYVCKHDSFDRRIGDLSYVIYLVHPIVICLFISVDIEIKPILILVATVTMSCLLYQFVERPIEKFRSKIN